MTTTRTIVRRNPICNAMHPKDSIDPGGARWPATDHCSGDRVEADREDDHVNVNLSISGSDPGFVDFNNRCLANVDEFDVGPVEGLEVSGVNAGAFGADVV